MSPRVAVALAAVLNLIGAFLSVTVAATIASGIVDQTTITVPIIFAGLVGAIIWNVITWYKGIPSSSSHALVGGVIGSVLAAEGSGGVLERRRCEGADPRADRPVRVRCRRVRGDAAGVSAAPARGERTAPRTGFRLSQMLSQLAGCARPWHERRPKDDGRDRPDARGRRSLCARRRRAQLGEGELRGRGRAGHVLGWLEGDPHPRHKVTTVEPPQGFSAETASATTILASTFFGFSLSTTQVVSGGVVGTGMARAGEVVHWSVVRRMVGAWVLTVPAAGLVGAVARRPSVPSQAPLLASSLSRR